MQPIKLKSIDHHARARPLSISHHRALSLPAVRTRPLIQLIGRPKPLTAAQLQRHSPKAPNPKTPTSAPKTTPKTRAAAPLTRPNSKIDRYHNIGAGKVLVIIGNGPSHRMAPLDRLKGITTVDIMSINKPDDRLWPTTYWLFCDNTQLNRHRTHWEQYRNPCFNTPSVKEEKSNTVRIKSQNTLSFSIDLNAGIHIGRSSVYTAMQLAAWMNYDKIYIFGIDMSAVEGKLYAWGHNPDVSDNVRAKRFEAEAKSYQFAADNLPDEVRQKFIFCSEFNPWPFIKQFQVLKHNEAVDVIIEQAKQT